MMENLLIEFHAFARHILTSLSVDAMLLQRYVIKPTTFRGLPIKVEIAPTSLQLINSALFVLI